MKLAALLCGVVASAFVWVASQVLADTSAAFLALWPASNSQQFLGNVVWQALCAAGLVGGLVTVLRPTLGGVVLLGAAAAWAAAGLRLPSGIDLQLLVPLVLNAVGGFAAFGAAVRGFMRRRATKRDPEAEDAAGPDLEQRLEPSIELHRAVEDQRQQEPEAVVVEEAPEPEAALEVQTGRVAAPPRRRLTALLAANMVVLVLLAGAVTLLVYVDIKTGQFAAAFGRVVSEGGLAQVDPVVTDTSGLALGSATEAAPVDAPAIASEAGTRASALAAPKGKPAKDVLTASLDRSLLPARSAPAAEVRVSTVPLEVAAVGPAEWTDPFAYCAAVGTMDFPDRRYAGPALVEPIADTLRVPVSSPPDRVKWRCVDGAVWACANFDWPVCAMTPTVPEMAEFCTKNPNAIGLQAPSGNWSCDGTQPVIPEGESWPVDKRGFLPGAWIEIRAAPPTDSIG